MKSNDNGKKGKWNTVGWNYRTSDCKPGPMLITVIYWIETKANLTLTSFTIKDRIKITKIPHKVKLSDEEIYLKA